MAGACWSSVTLCGAQFNRLDCDGVPLDRTDGDGKNVVVNCGMVDITRTEEVGDELSQRETSGQGGFAAVRVRPAQVNGYTYTFTLSSRLDADLLALFGITDAVKNAAGDTVGFKAKDISQAADCDCGGGVINSCLNPGFSMMLWSLAWSGEDIHPDYRYAIEAAPKLLAQPGWERVKSTEFNTVELTMATRANAGWGRGPSNIYPETAGLDRHWAEWLTNRAYPGGCSCDLCGFVLAAETAITPIETKIVTVSATAADATLTATVGTFAASDVGRSVVVAGAGAGGANLTTTILTFTDSTHVEMATNALTTVAGATATIN